MGIEILGTGICTPDNEIKNQDLEERGFDSDWIVQRTGIMARRHALPGQATSDLAFAAAEACLENANVGPDEIDLIICATMTPDHFTPSTACLIQARLGSTAAAVDMNAACSGFMYGMITAGQFLKTGCSKKALVVGAEVMSMVVDPEDKKTYPLFGDGAGAAVLSATPSDVPESASGILAYRLASEGDLDKKLYVPGGCSRRPATPEMLNDRDQFLKMDGRSVFKWAVRLIPEMVNEVLAKADLVLDDLDLIIFHQANRRILDAAGESLGIDPDKMFVNLDRYGNTSAASIPLSLHEAYSQGRITKGSTVMLAGFGAGFTWGTAIIRW